MRKFDLRGVTYNSRSLNKYVILSIFLQLNNQYSLLK